MKNAKKITAYFSMEFAFDDRIPNFAGGLGVLAGDIMLSAADLGAAVAGVSLIYHLDDDPKKAFRPDRFMKRLKQNVEVEIENRKVKVAVWEMKAKGKSGRRAPVYFLDTYLPENKRWDRDLTKTLYAGDAYTRLCQEIILGVGGVRALAALGHEVGCYHMNEGHAAAATLENLKNFFGDAGRVREKCVFTTHTPLGSGHDYFDYDLARKIMGGLLPANIKELSLNDRLGMTQLALNLSKKHNAVSVKHMEVCQALFPPHRFEAVDNGIYHPRWAGKHMAKLFDKHIKGWQTEPEKLRGAVAELPEAELKEARAKEKKDFIAWVNAEKSFFPLPDLKKHDLLDEKILTVGFARRMVPYKRADLIFQNIHRLREIGYEKLQLVFAGNPYQDDAYSTRVVALIKEMALELRGQIKVVFIPKYNLEIARRLVAGCDVWLNNPVPGSEASGTSGMKAALNGVLNASVMDGWWIEAYHSDVKSGWGFGEFVDGQDRDVSDNSQLLSNLKDIVDCYGNRSSEWLDKIRHSIALIAYFNTHRTLREYQTKMWEG